MRQFTYTAAVRAAQSVITMYSPNMAVDGKWGSYTQSKYESLESADRKMVDDVLQVLHTSAAELRRFRMEEKERASEMTASYDGTVESGLAAAAARTGVPLDHLRGFARIESHLDPKASNGASRGLMQMQPGAWSDMMKVDSSLKDYKSVFDPYQNALAGALYYKQNHRAITRIPGFTGPVEPAMVYIAHQQGLGGFAELWNASQGRKTTSYVTERALRGNPPQDGAGVTLDKAQFYNRWLTVARKKIGS